MPTYEHASSIGSWFFKALVESAKLRSMTFNEEAAHRNKPNCRVQAETRQTAGVPAIYAQFDEPHVLILQGTHCIVDEATTPQDFINAYIPYPQGPGLAPFLRRPVPVVGGWRALITNFFASTLEDYSYLDITTYGTPFSPMKDEVDPSVPLAMPETAIGVTGIDAGTDFKTSLVIAHRWSNNASGSGIGEVHHGGYLFWRVIGHVAAY